MAKTKSLIKQPRLHPNLCPTAKLRVLQKIDGFLCSLAIIWHWHKASLRHKDTSHPRPSSVTSLFWDGALWNWDKQLLKKKKLSSNIILDCVKWSEMHYGLAWVVLDSPSIVWALVAGLSLLMLPHLFQSLDACRGFHLEKCRHEMTWEGHKEQPSMGRPGEWERYCKQMYHFCRGSVTIKVPIFLTLHQSTHLSGLGCSRLRFNRWDLSWHRLKRNNNSVKIGRKRKKQLSM